MDLGSDRTLTRPAVRSSLEFTLDPRGEGRGLGYSPLHLTFKSGAVVTLPFPVDRGLHPGPITMLYKPRLVHAARRLEVDFLPATYPRVPLASTVPDRAVTTL